MKASDELLKIKKEVSHFCWRGVYFLLKNDEVVYVGKTVTGLIRIHTHTADKDFTHYCFINCKELTDEELLCLETKYILKYEPKLNRTITHNEKWCSLHKFCLETETERKWLDGVIRKEKMVFPIKKIGSKEYYEREKLMILIEQYD